MGDFNAKIGTDIARSNSLGQCMVGRTNENGLELLAFANINNLKIASTFFKKKTSQRWTWQSPDGKQKMK